MTFLARWTRAVHVLAVIVAVAVVATVTWAVWPDPPRKYLTAHFPRTIGLYEGSDVRVLGVPIGTVDKVTPQGQSVEVRMSYEAKYKIPADAKAAIVAPSIVSDRYVQLAPVYERGPVMADGHEISLSETATPVELDRIYSSLDDLAVALGPNGANQGGSLSKLLKTSARNLDGEGEQLHTTVEDLSSAVGTLSSGREDLFATVRQLQQFTSKLAENDAHVREFNSDLDLVAEQLAGERDDLQRALDNLAIALTDVRGFVHANRDELRTNVDGLTKLSRTLVKQQDALRETLENAPVALANLDNAYNPRTGTLDTRNNFAQLDDPGLYLCSLLLQAGQPQSVCDDLRAILDLLPDLPEIPGGPASNVPNTGSGTTPGRDLTLGGILADPKERDR
jgi:phospholipid/cholesterol/gamma-HCH transport system substrate-binding protein